VSDELPGLDEPRVSKWLVQVADLEPPIRLRLIAAGGSNLTFEAVDGAGTRVALRRPPTRGRLASAHDLDREWKVLTALAPSAVPVPRALARCDDDAVTGAPFYVMAFVDGTILRTATDGDALSPDVARRASDALVDTHAALHALDADEVGLGELGPRDGYLARQLGRWKAQYEQAKVRELPALVELHDRLLRALPPDRSGGAIIHGDYRFDNVVLGTRGEVRAVLDWELCTLGDPLADACWSFMYWADPGDPYPFLPDPPTVTGAFPRRAEVAERYAAVSGRPLDHLDFYEAFGWWKMACIVEGVYARRLAGGTGGGATQGTEAVAARTERLLELAADAARRLP